MEHSDNELRCNELQPSPNRLRIGVTGHRFLVDTDALRMRINEALDSVHEEFQQTGNELKELVVVTMLAEGADRLVAREVLRRPHSRLKAILPLIPEEYCEDFRLTVDGAPKPQSEAEKSITEFEELLALDDNPVFLRHSPLSDHFPEDQVVEERANAYYEAGEYLVDHSEVLIAVWDGEPSRGKGGTADVVAMAKKKPIPVYWIKTVHS